MTMMNMFVKITMMIKDKNEDEDGDDDEGGEVVPLLTWGASGAPSLQIRHSSILLESG